ncbi:stonin-2-like [Lytechinus pictus]|uniref:stonin-2-like n=1 Tax=Lytechinus pictus TaxID=7653 RepID=UPI0030B9C215
MVVFEFFKKKLDLYLEIKLKNACSLFYPLPLYDQCLFIYLLLYAGGSVQSGADVTSQASDDHHSAVASSVISSRGSFSGSHDNISSSREYMPLESLSSSPKPGNVTPHPEQWVRFGDSRKVVSSTPLKSVVPVKGISEENGSLDTSRVSSPAPAQWVQFNYDNDVTISSTSSRPSPVLSSCENSITQECPVEELHVSAMRDSRPLETTKKEHATPSHIQVKKLKQEDISFGIHINSSRTVTATSTPVHMTDHAHDLEVSMLSEVASASDSKYETASPGNPFKADMLTLKQLEKQKVMEEQVRRTVSPYNPFLNLSGSELVTTPVKSNAPSTWTTFDDTDGASANNQKVPSSPGNPFADIAVASNVPNRSNVSASFTPQQQVQGQAIFAAAAAAQQSAAAAQQNVSAAQPVRQVMAVQPLMQSSAVQHDDKLTTAILSPASYASQPVSPIGMKPNQWQQQQQFFPTSPQSGYSSTHQNISLGKQTLAAIVSPTTTSITEGSDMPDSGKLAFNTQTSIKSNLSSPYSDKLFQDQYPREQEDLSIGWPLKLRVPDKKRIAGSRSWQPIHVKLAEGNILQLYYDRTRKEPFRELPLQSNYEISHPNLQQFDYKGKIHTIKLLYISYKEKRRVSAKSMYEKESHLEELMKLGSLDFKVFQSFVFTINDALMKLTLYQDRGAHYQQDMIKVVVSDECRCFVNDNGDTLRQSISVSLNILSFLSGSPDCAIGLNDVQIKGMDVVARQHIIPNKTSDWIKMNDVELHKCANKNVFVDSRMIEFQPLNACRFRLMQFHIQPSEDEDLPLQVKAAFSGEGTHMELRVDLLVPACSGKRNPNHFLCENILVHIPIPEHWISYFRKPKRVGQSSIHAVIKRADIIKRGCLHPKLLEISVGTAKYEHAYRAVMWRIDRLPEKSSGHPSTHIFKCHLNLSSIKEVSKSFSRNVEVEYHTPHTTASKTTVRSLAVSSEKSPEKRIRYMARYEYQVQITDNYIRHSPVDDDDAPGRCLQQ